MIIVSSKKNQDVVQNQLDFVLVDWKCLNVSLQERIWDHRAVSQDFGLNPTSLVMPKHVKQKTSISATLFDTVNLRDKNEDNQLIFSRATVDQ